MRKTTNFFKVKIPILNDEYSVWVIWGEIKNRQKWLRKYFDDDSICLDKYKDCRATTHRKIDTNPVINMNINKDYYGTLAHEAVHAINDIFEYIGDDNRGELFAHSVGSIVRRVEKYENIIKRI